MNIEGFLQRLVAVLEQVGIPYMLSGSLASAFYGIPRSTQDIDIVVELDITRLRALITALPQEMYYVSEPAAVDALRRQGQFNVIDMETGWKVDLIVRKRRPFSRTEFERRRSEEVLGVPLVVCSPEDSILGSPSLVPRHGATIGRALALGHSSTQLHHLELGGAEGDRIAVLLVHPDERPIGL